MGRGRGPHYDPFGENVERRWLVLPASLAKLERFGRGDGWCFDVGLSQMPNRWLAQGARERACGTLVFLRGPRMAIGEQLSYTCLGNDNDTVVFIVTGAVEFVAFRLTTGYARDRSNLPETNLPNI